MDVYYEGFDRAERDASDQAVARLLEFVSTLAWFQEAVTAYSQRKYRQYKPEVFVNLIVSAARDMRRHGLFK